MCNLLFLSVVRILEEFGDVFPNDLPPGIPPIRGIEHQIDLVPRASLPNKTAYRCNPKKLKSFKDRLKS